MTVSLSPYFDLFISFTVFFSILYRTQPQCSRAFSIGPFSHLFITAISSLLFISVLIFKFFYLQSVLKNRRLNVADRQNTLTCKKTSFFTDRPSFQLRTSTINTTTPRIITIAHKKLDTVWKSELLNVFHTLFVSLLQVTAGIIHVREALDIFLDFDFYSNLHSFHVFCTEDFHEIGRSIACSTCSNK